MHDKIEHTLPNMIYQEEKPGNDKSVLIDGDQIESLNKIIKVTRKITLQR